MSVLCRFLCLLNCIPEYLACTSDALLIGVSIHPQCDSLVRVSQLFRYTGNVCAIGDGNTGKAVPEYLDEFADEILDEM